MLKDKKILLCLCGGIAVYKCVEIASLLVKEGAIVKTIMTESAMQFITPLTFRSITKETVSYKLFNPDAPIEHISLADWADLVVIVPATANIIGKIAHGIADDLLSTVVMATTCPKLIVPAMNVHMYENSIVQENINKLREHKYHILEPEEGSLACGYTGKGRMPSPYEIVFAIKSSLYYQLDFLGKKVLVSAGASIEKIDPMRHITNVSSGKMGLSLARAAFLRGAETTIVYSSLKEILPYYTHNIEALSAKEMHAVIMKIAHQFDIIIMCAAVADYTPKIQSKEKIKKKGDLIIELVRTDDILFELGKKKKVGQLLVGFAAESENVIENAREKLVKKNLDMIVGNKLDVAGEEDSEITIIRQTKGQSKPYADKNKVREVGFSGDKFYLANKILDCMSRK